MVVGITSFSLMSVLVKLAGARLPSQEIVLARAILTLIFSIAMLRAAGIMPWGDNRRLLLLRGLLGFTGLSCFYYSLVHLPLAEATLIQSTNPVFAALLAPWLLREALRRRELVCIAVSLAGVLLVTQPQFITGTPSTLAPLAVTIAVMGSLASGLTYVLVRHLGASEDPLVIVFYFALVSSVGSIPFAIPGFVVPNGTELLLLLGIGITTQIGQVCITHGLRLERAGKATAIGYLQVVLAVVWGVLFFHERPNALSLLGAVLIVGSTLALTLSTARQPAVVTTPPPAES
jgi:drug/metabolite transporter (DMT)-like permease